MVIFYSRLYFTTMAYYGGVCLVLLFTEYIYTYIVKMYRGMGIPEKSA